MFKQECGDNFNSQTEQMIIDIEQIGNLSKQHKGISKKMKKGQIYSFTILDSTKWPIKSDQENVVALPKQLKDVFEEFTQMYEKSKRTNKSTENDNK